MWSKAFVEKVLFKIVKKALCYCRAIASVGSPFRKSKGLKVFHEKSCHLLQIFGEKVTSKLPKFKQF